jgi:hypothetical protein
MKTPRIAATASVLTLLAVACGGGREATVAADAGKLAPPSATTAEPARTEVAAVDPCSLVSAAEVGSIVGQSVVSQVDGEGCDYSLDPSAASAPPSGAASRAKTGGAPSLMGALGQGGDFSKVLGAASHQLLLTLTADRDGMTEAQVRAIHERTGEAVRGAVQPESRGLGDVLRPGADIPGVADWAFATNVAAVNMGFGLSSRGRILEAGRGPWHLTLTVNVSPDPGPETLDRQLAAIAHAACGKLSS